MTADHCLRPVGAAGKEESRRPPAAPDAAELCPAGPGEIRPGAQGTIYWSI